MANGKELAARWSGPGALLAEEVLARLIAGRTLTGLGLDEHEGRIDLRYLPAPTARRLERFQAQGWFIETLGELITFRGVELAGLDLSGAQLQSLRFHDASVVDSRFDAAACRDWRLWGTTVTGCSFRRADLRGAVVGSWHQGRRNEWRRVDFSGSDFRVIATDAALFEDCEFVAAKLDKVQFDRCAMVRCHFAGDLTDVIFDERELPGRAAAHPLENVDFADARFNFVEFRGCQFDQVALPADPDVRLVKNYRCVVEHALAMIQGDDSRAAQMLRGEFENALRMMRGPEDNVFNRRDYLDSEELAQLATIVIGRAEAACRS